MKDPNSAKFHVEQTAAAMSDLADMLGIDQELLGFRGRLGMVFGARGSGGKNAARAHYEPIHRVINLTKMGGGGSLGHEYFHALDNVMHELVNAQSSGKKNEFVTANPNLLPEGELRDAVKALSRAIMDGDLRAPEVIKFTEKDVNTAKYNIDAPRNRIARAIKDAGSATAGILAVDAFLAPSSTGNSRIAKQRNQWRKLAVAYYASEGKTMATLAVGKGVSSFAFEAATLDKGQLGSYWSQLEELSARGFQAWIEDRMAQQERQNDYLSAFADNKYRYDPLLDIQYKPFPEGDERIKINAAFDNLFEVIRKNQVFEKANANEALLDSIFNASQVDSPAPSLQRWS
ncbi:LPD1 domain-containing protein [Collimonas sp. PA-H2]|uniref:LPD1 domain-containing protein n=1 Tax=Collimonas sp. PA-H2 TaxID=1881062 RepID=UPI000BF5DDB5|nr:LPD1 domain-containing protein [Collimonas sp. PA-H2]